MKHCRRVICGIAMGLIAVAAVAQAATAPKPGPRPAPPPMRRPPVRMPAPGAPSSLYGELPNTPETPPEKLPAQYFATVGETEIQYAQWAKAEAAFTEAYAREKDLARRAAYAYRLGQLHIRKKAFDKAAPLIEEAVKNQKGETRGYETRRYRMTLASLYEKMNQPEKVEAIYQDWVKSAEATYERDMARRQLLSFWQRTGKLDDVIARYEAVVKEKPGDPEALSTLRLIYTSVKPDPEKSLAITEKLAAADPADRDTALQLVSAYERARHYDKAIPILEKLIETNPTDASFLSSRLVHLYVQNKQNDKAMAFAKAMLAKEPDNPETHSRVASIYQRLNMVDDSLAEYEAAANLSKSDAQRDRYLLSAAHAARRAKKYAKAEELAKKLAASSSKMTAAQAKRLLFDLYEEQNKLDQLEIAPQKEDEKKGN